MKAYRLLLKGRLFQTGFRFYALKKAVELNVKGYVTYTSDRDVLIHAEGVEENLDPFIQWCGKGLLCCKVTHTDISETTPEQHREFRILR